jgi:hypothetical protein
LFFCFTLIHIVSYYLIFDISFDYIFQKSIYVQISNIYAPVKNGSARADKKGRKILSNQYIPTTIQIKKKIKEEAKIPWCKQIEEVSIENTDASYLKLKKHGISSNVA